MKLLVLGAGAWGTALAVHACALGRAGRVSLWARNPLQHQMLQQDRVNSAYLPGVPLARGLHLPSPEALPGEVRESDLVVLGTPSTALGEWVRRLDALSCKAPVVWLSKGFVCSSEVEGSWLPHELATRLAPGLRCGVFSGPSFAQEVAQGKPTAMVAASVHGDITQSIMTAFHGGALRVYANDDVVGVEVGGAVKNVMAIATGLCDGLGFGLNARAALITRGLAEMTRLGVALGARMETFMGLSGLGDLVLTATGDLSRNRQVGLLLAAGQSLEQALGSLGHVAEGVNSARIVWSRAQSLGVDMPITGAVLQVLEGRLSPDQAVALLMGRAARSEG